MGIKRELRPLFQKEPGWHVHILFRHRDCDGGKLRLGVHKLQLTLHLLDLFADAPEFFLDCEEIVDVVALAL